MTETMHEVMEASKDVYLEIIERHGENEFFTCGNCNRYQSKKAARITYGRWATCDLVGDLKQIREFFENN